MFLPKNTSRLGRAFSAFHAICFNAPALSKACTCHIILFCHKQIVYPDFRKVDKYIELIFNIY